VLNAIILLGLLFPLASVNIVIADEEMTSHLICPCGCAMIISTCDCATAIQIKKEIRSMNENGFSEKQIISALVAEYGNDIIAQDKKDFTSLWAGGIILSIVLLILGYFGIKKLKPAIIILHEKYERQFEEEYKRFVDETEEK